MSQYPQQIRKKLHLHPAETSADAGPQAVASVNRDEAELSLLLGEFNHRIRNLLTMTEAVIRQTRSATVEDYRLQLMARISSLRRFHEIDVPAGATVALAELLRQTMRPYCAERNQVFAVGNDLDLEPKLALALHLVFHELAMNAKKYGALSSPFGSVNIRWESRHMPDVARRLAIVWSEHGGPKVKFPQHRGFGSHLIASALQPDGQAQLDFNATGLVCYIAINLDRHASARSLG